MAAVRERLGIHVPAATDMYTRMVLSARAVPRSYQEDNWDSHVSSVRESVKKRFSWNGAVIRRGLERGS
jgi:hypothetical protein